MLCGDGFTCFFCWVDLEIRGACGVNMIERNLGVGNSEAAGREGGVDVSFVSVGGEWSSGKVVGRL